MTERLAGFVAFFRTEEIEVHADGAHVEVQLRAVDVGYSKSWAEPGSPRGQLWLQVGRETSPIFQRGQLVAISVQPVPPQELTLTPEPVSASPIVKGILP